MTLTYNKIEKKDFEIYYNLYCKIIHPMKDSWYVKQNKENLYDDFTDNKEYFILKYNNQKCGFLTITYYKNKNPYEIKEKEISVLEAIAILKEFRKLGIAKQALEYAMNRCKERNYKTMVATVHPDNIASLKAFRKNDFKKIKEFTFLKSHKRILFQKEL